MIINNEQFKRAYQSAGVGFICKYIAYFLENKKRLEDREEKRKIIEEIYEESNDKYITATRTRVNALLKIIQANRVKESLEVVINSKQTRQRYPKDILRVERLLETLE
ncbi:hypothetical protein [uncultured Clostridium sp.]|uniref:hypothetical protein n=1 Tax=uncultured Clostridium sp. TaxID=59620 RepID=UPI0026340537|nr:hypothetical protein [uncultured Clostridium sp.]